MMFPLCYSPEECSSQTLDKGLYYSRGSVLSRASKTKHYCIVCGKPLLYRLFKARRKELQVNLCEIHLAKHPKPKKADELKQMLLNSEITQLEFKTGLAYANL
jgi:hypothetical protein